MTDFKKNQGAMWHRMSKNNHDYLSGQIEIDGKKIGFMAFHNKKETDKQPDYKIYLNDDKPQAAVETQAPLNTATVPIQPTLPSKKEEEIDISKIPF